MIDFYVKFLFFIVTSILISHLSSSERKVTFTWQCIENTNTCIKKLADKSSNENVQSYKVCNLLCGESSIIWPEPVRSEINGPPIYINDIVFEDNLHTTYSKSPSRSTQNLLNEAINVFMGRIMKENATYSKTMINKNLLKVNINIKNTELVDLTLQTNESYQISAPKFSTDPNIVKVLIKGETFFGVRHALETLSQLIVYDNVNDGLVIPKKIEITDYPRYPYRGFMLDTSRNYFSVQSIMRTIDAMSMNKLNRFHWHITDTHSFPLKLEKYKLFAEYGAYSPEKVYTEEDIKYLVEYAMVRGIRIVPELDAPAHCGEGWQAVPDSQICFDKEPFSEFCPEPPCGQLNPLNKEVYDTLGGLYAELLRLFQPDIFHMGGDEVSLSCWKTSDEIQKWIDSKGDEHTGYYELWNAFQKKAFNKLMRAQRNLSAPEFEVVLWTSRLTDKYNLNVLKPYKYIIQVWDNVLEDTKVLTDLLDNDFRIILSNVNPLYLDCGHGSWVSGGADWCSPYKTWQSIYHNSIPEILKIPEEKKHLILGQEAALWTESAGEESLDLRVWPRVAALSERTWSNPSTIWKDAENRMLYHRNRLINLGINADAIEPEWCAINKGGCGHADASLLVMRNEVISFSNPSITIILILLSTVMVLLIVINFYRKIIGHKFYTLVSRRNYSQRL